MSDVAKRRKTDRSTDLVLQEIWHIKDTLSASYGHDVDRLFADARKRQKLSGHPVVNLQTKRRKAP
jgi:hypothetical protein